ncbi:MAG: AI-2E family transporter [Oscillospiraceae bacterium]|nr:AI-2E family transporter [Oscillospiraceae bacterium]
MKKTKHKYLCLMLALFGAAALSIILFFLLFRFDGLQAAFHTLMGVLMPFVVGSVIAYLLKPSCNWVEKRLTAFSEKRGKKSLRAAPGLSIAITLLLALAVIVILMVLVLPTLLDSVYSVLLLIPDSIRSLASWVMQYVGNNETLSNYITEFSEGFSTSIPDWISSTVIPNLEQLIGSVAGGVSGAVTLFKNLFIGLIAAIYILAGRKKFAAQAKLLNYSLFGEKWSSLILDEVRYADRVFSGFINGRLIDSLIIGVICFVGMLILRIPYAVLVSVIVGVTNIIPFFGPYIGAIPSFLLILMVSPVKAVIFLIFILILQQFDGNILGPRILGDVTGLSGFWVLFAILTFGGLFGFVGMLIGVPVFAVLYDIVRKLVHYGAERRRDAKPTAVSATEEPDAAAPAEKS